MFIFLFFSNNNYSPPGQTVLFNKLCRSQGLKTRYYRRITFIFIYLLIFFFIIIPPLPLRPPLVLCFSLN